MPVKQDEALVVDLGADEEKPEKRAVTRVERGTLHTHWLVPARQRESPDFVTDFRG